MPQGLSNSGSTFSSLMQCVLGDIIGTKVLLYLDDCIVFSNTFEEHFENLRAVFTRLRTAGLKLKPSKCNFFQEQVEYLGHFISAAGIRSYEQKPRKIENRGPQTKTIEM